MTSLQRNVLVLSIAAVAVIVVWLSWVWSPTPQTDLPEPEDGEEALAVPQPTLPTPPAPPVNTPPPAAAVKVEPQQPVAAPPEEKPERIPTPHPLSLDQTRPPEAYGPLAEYKQRYESESRGPASTANEQKFRDLLDVPNIHPELVRDVSCRRSMCKLQMAWRPERRLGFVVTVESSKNLYDKRVAVEPGTRQDDGTYLSNIYIRLTP